ncbi:Ni,Fe-hydrogenase I cytochrome b subunit [Anaerosolibacter carboniphilus]|uniref:Ni,Fe-hydrogenase I cytochrome b subunit n=1 Tax=Anaerosolibacter carboniphilus TaxID=1417629 RepID=A0A841KU83_9FIRM|nr:Ni,Fe-hydrogenase I cytochrome b subunit [Anaerosolibacter carboniphilus]
MWRHKSQIIMIQCIVIIIFICAGFFNIDNKQEKTTGFVIATPLTDANDTLYVRIVKERIGIVFTASLFLRCVYFFIKNIFFLPLALSKERLNKYREENMKYCFIRLKDLLLPKHNSERYKSISLH